MGGGKRTRTADICRAKAALYQLSYTPSRDGLELRTRLTYRQIILRNFLGVEAVQRNGLGVALQSNARPLPVQRNALGVGPLPL